VTTEVNIAQLKARFSEYLRAVREGQEITIKDRDRAVAKIVPLQPPRREKLEIRPAHGKPADLDRIKPKRPAGLKPGAVFEALRWTRRERYGAEE
jgi:prevent-host-death family protein